MAESWERLWTVFEQALDRPAAQRPTFLDEACGDDDELRRAVEEMLDADRETDAFLDRPVVERRAGNGDRPATRPALDGPNAIGPYRLQRKVGEGGMSSVYLAVRDDDTYQRRVVVKIVRRGMEREAVLRRLRTERQILASLDHPHVASLYDGGSTEDGLPYFVMEHVDGLPIDTYCERNRLPLAERLALFLKVCAAVHYAHQNLVVHRDIKPSNILVTAGGEPKLLDFGIAKLLNPELAAAELEPTVTATRMLTPSYASPEQIRGELVTTASDVYSLGVLLYRLLTGALPYDFTGRSPAEIERLVTDSEPARPSQVVESPPTDGEETTTTGRFRHQLAGDLDAIVLKAMRSAPRERYGSVDRLATDVDRYLRGLPVEARRGTVRYRAAKFIRRHRTGVLVAALIIAIVLNFGIALARQSARTRQERDQARLERDKKQQVISLFEEIIGFAEPYVAPGEELTVRQAVEQSVPRLESQLNGQPEVRAQLLHTTGAMMTRLGALEGAHKLLLEALDLRRRHYGEGSREAAETEIALASLLKLGGRHDEAEALARQAVATMRSLAGEGHPDHVASLNELVSVLCYKEQYLAAEEPAIEALRLARLLGDDERRLRMRALGRLAVVRQNLGDYREAAALQRESLAIRRALYGDDHPSQRNTLGNLALNLRWLGELRAAERTTAEMLSITASLYGETHWEYAYALNNLAGLRFAQGRYQEALDDYARVVEVFGAAVRPGHWRHFFFAVRLEAARIRTGDTALAVRNLRREIGNWSSRLGEDHWLTAFARCILGEALAAEGELAEAEALLTEGFVKLVEIGAKHRYQSQALERLTAFLQATGRAGEVPRYAAMVESPAS